MYPDLIEAVEFVDNVFSSGATFHNKESVKEMRELLARWGRNLDEAESLIEEDPEDAEVLEHCHDCGAKPGENHMPGCDTERCPACGGQALQCLSDDSGKLMCNNTDTEVSEGELLPWTGIWPGVAECREYGFWCKGGVGGWVPCDKDDPEARENLNRLYDDCVWDRAQKKFVLRK